MSSSAENEGKCERETFYQKQNEPQFKFSPNFGGDFLLAAPAAATTTD